MSSEKISLEEVLSSINEDKSVMELLSEKNESNYSKHSKFHVVKGEEGHVLYSETIDENFKSGHGVIHGGAISAFIDHVAGAVAYSDFRLYVTASGNISFISNTEDDMIYAEGTCLHRGKKIVNTRVRVFDKSGKLLATGEFLLYCIDKPFKEMIKEKA